MNVISSKYGVFKFTVMLILIICFFEADAQFDLSVPYTPIDSFKTTARDTFYLNKLGDVYKLNNQETLSLERDNTNTLTAKDEVQYANLALSKITSVDFRDPFYPVVFYEEQQQIVILTRVLSVSKTIDLTSLNIGYISCVGAGYDGSIWCFSVDLQQLVKISKAGEVDSYSLPLNRIFRKQIEILELKASSTFIYACTKDQRIIYFDNLSTYQSDILQPASQLIAAKNGIVFRSDNQWVNFDLSTNLQTVIQPFDDKYQMACFNNEFILIKQKDSYLFAEWIIKE